MTTANIPNDPVAIQRFFTSRDNNANAETYVGQEQRLWYDPTTNAIYVSDGNTAGGIPVGSAAIGNGVPGGPANSIQYNAGGTNFGGSSNFTYDGTILTITGNTVSTNFLSNNYLYANGDSIFNNAPFTGTTTFANISVTNTANLGNLTITDQTISGTITDRDIVLNPVANGIVNVNGPFHVHSGNLTADPIFQVTTDGRVKTLVPNSSSVNGAFNIVGSIDGTEVLPQNYGVMLHMTGQPTIPARFYSDGVANYAAYVGRRYNGISSAPTAVLNNQIMNRVSATPYVGDTTSGWPTISTVRIDFVTTENQTATNNGGKIQMWATPTGTDVANIALIADFKYGGINLTGNLIPTVDNIYSLGNVTNRWVGAYFGNAGIYIQDTTLDTTGSMSLDNGVMLFDSDISALQVGNIKLTNTGLLSTVSTQDIVIGTPGDTGNTVIRNAGVKFTDGSVQTTAAIPLTQKGNAFGVVPLNSSTKIDPAYLPAGDINFLGVWNAANNTPTLADGVGNAGDKYIVGVAGTQNLGSGPITFAVGDFALYTSANVWVDIPVGTPGVTAFNGRTGNVTLLSGDVTNALSTGSIVNSKLLNPNVTVSTGAGLSGGQVVPLGGTITLINTGVTAAIAGTGVAVSAATGNVTFSIGQAVGTANTVQFGAITSTSTIQATSNISAGNLSTGGRLVATGQISTSDGISAAGNITGSYIFGNGSQLTGLNAFQTVAANGTNLLATSTSGVLTVTPGNNLVITANSVTDTMTVAVSNSPTFSGNVSGGNLLTGGLISATGNVQSGNIRTTGLVSATGNITGGNLIAVTNTNTVSLSVTGLSNLNSNANVKITGGAAGQQLTTDGVGNLSWSFAQAGNTIIQSAANTTVNVNFTTNNLHLLYLPTGPVTVSLSNYTAGAQGRVIVRFGATPYTITMGVGNVQQTTEGLLTIPTSGGGGHKISGNQSVQLLYTCFDNTAGNCYVASTFL